MPWGYAAVAVGSLAASKMQSDAAEAAGRRSANAADAATAEQRREYDQTRQDQMPWYNVGKGALSQLAGLYGLNTTGAGAPVGPVGGQPGTAGYEKGSLLGGLAGGTSPDYSAFYQSPDYQFALNQGLQGLDRSAAARGGLYSGGHQADVLDYAEGLATQNFNNYANRLSNLAGVGQSTATNLGNLGAQTASRIGNIGLNNAQLQNQSSYDKTNAWSNFGNQLVGAFGQWYGGQNKNLNHGFYLGNQPGPG